MSISDATETMIISGGHANSMLKLINDDVVETITVHHIIPDTSSSSTSMPVGRCFMIFFLDMK